VMCRLHSWIRP